ncbi:MAG TPA: ATP-binding cassette domain-containing protein [Bryobacteraceae bacterium]|nr:ATP-binding cassette domain-containing protein [Bryobacteraceae bacterium]
MTSARIARQGPHGFSLDVEFSLEPGITALYGPAGAGKTLLLEALAGFTRPDSGRILLQDVLLFDAAARVCALPHRRAIGWVSHADSLFPHMTVRQNFAFAAHGRPRVERARRVAEALEKFQLSPVASSLPAAIAPPEKLRAAVARALLAEPKLLLLDERRWQEPLVRQVRESFGGPVLLVTGDLDLCCAAASRLLVLSAGRIVADAAPRDVLDRPETIEAARALGIPNIFECAISALDPGRHTSRLDLAEFSIAGPYIPGHFRGDRVSIAIRPEELRVHDGASAPPASVEARLVRVLPGLHRVRLEFSGGIFADLPPEEYEAKKDAQSWRIEFPPDKVRALRPAA